mmetsp:Transcript_75034/g.132921  ORF Transcript_75034/g.132921 Transcript_75034/m.132921 type:complete len:271 (-) Transcript_75034:2-814(-)
MDSVVFSFLLALGFANNKTMSESSRFPGISDAVSSTSHCKNRNSSNACTGSTESMIEVLMIADVVCPYCYIGYWRLQKAVSKVHELGLPFKVQIKYEPFILRRHLPREGIDKISVFRKQFGSEAQARQVFAGISQTAAADRLCFDPTGQRAGNSEDAHRLLLWAGSFGKTLALYESMVKAYNCERGWLGDHEVLVSCAAEVGLNAGDARMVLNNASHGLESLNTGLDYSNSLGVSGVPYFVVVNKSKTFSGAISSAEFVHFFKKLAGRSM